MSGESSVRLSEDNGRYFIEAASPESSRYKLDSFDDSRIWELFQEGHESAFIHIYRRYFDALFSFGSQFSNSEALVEDAIQDMFIELREKRGNTVIRNSIKSYLFTCLRRRILLYKSKFDSRIEPIENGAFQPFEVGISMEQLLIESQIKEEQKKKLENGLKLLTERQREAIYYLYHEGMSYYEIKDLMNFSNIRSTRNLIYRAIKTIKSSILFVMLSIVQAFLI
ncbi:MAG: sigma-70 family RNA polymerase sigma factor [Cyclobacteriaceae bacterium]|nr:sigma-70 family RNA polymerase sigma factor [Cyclobacteriaceae bacterium SS2]